MKLPGQKTYLSGSFLSCYTQRMPVSTKDRDRDLLQTHTFTNYLNAGYQGQFAFLNVLSRLQHSLASPASVTRSREALAKIAAWTADLWKGISLFAANWQTPQTFEAQKALSMLEDLKADLGLISSNVLAVVSAEQATYTEDQLKYLLAALARSLYSKDNYLRGFVDYGKAFNAPDMINQYTPMVQRCSDEIALMHSLMNSYKEGKIDNQEAFRLDLRYRAFLLPGVFRSQMHDICQLTATYKGGLTYELAGIEQSRAEKWAQLGCPPQIAGYWEAYFIAPEEAFAWTGAGIREHETAAAWRLHGFTPATVEPWLKLNYPPAIAMRWAQAGFTAEKALEHIQRGTSDPAAVKPQQS